MGKGFDLSSLQTVQDEGATMELLDIEGEAVKDSKGKPITITILGVDAPVYKNSVSEQQNNMLTKRSRKGRNSGLDVEALQKIARVARAKSTTAWSGMLLKGKELECTFENVLMVYESIAEVDDQVAEFVADRANFIIA